MSLVFFGIIHQISVDPLVHNVTQLILLTHGILANVINANNTRVEGVKICS